MQKFVDKNFLEISYVHVIDYDQFVVIIWIEINIECSFNDINDWCIHLIIIILRLSCINKLNLWCDKCNDCNVHIKFSRIICKIPLLKSLGLFGFLKCPIIKITGIILFCNILK